MKLKSLFNKIKPGKKSEEEPFPQTEHEDDTVQHELSFDKKQTIIERVVNVAEIDVYVNNEKINIHTLATETKIGRDPSQSDIIISELIISKLHCTIYKKGDDFFIKDNQSTNGVYIEDERVEADRQLVNGDTILLGKKGTVKIVFHKR